MTTPRILVFQHAWHCPIGTFGDVLTERGIEPVTIEFYEGHRIPNTTAFDALVVLGGPMDVWETDANPWLVDEKAAIRDWVENQRKPMIGVCLGHQLLAECMGGDVQKAGKPEADVYSVSLSESGRRHPIMNGFQSDKQAISFHGCEVTRLPPGAELLASTDACPIAAFVVGPNAYGIQYHAEATDSIVRDWTDTPPARGLVESLYGPGSVPQVDARIRAAMPELKKNSRTLFENFLQTVV